MPKAGSITESGTERDFITFEGSFTSYANEVEIVTRSNIDGIAARRRAETSDVAVFRSARDAENTAGVQTLIDDYTSLQSKLVTVEDSTGNTHDNVLVQKVTAGSQKKIETAVGGLVSGTAQYIVRAQWLLQLTE